MNMTGGYRVARLYLGKQYISFKLQELPYLTYIFFARILNLEKMKGVGRDGFRAFATP
jgi:hypothetical protein